MLAILVPILTAVLPSIVSNVVHNAEAEMPNTSGVEKKSWVIGMFTDVWDVVELRVPSIAKYEAVFKTVVLPIVDSEIEKAVAKMKAPKA